MISRQWSLTLVRIAPISQIYNLQTIRAGISDISGASPRPFGPFSGQVRCELLQYHQEGGLKAGARLGMLGLELETNVHTELRNHGEGPY